MEKHGFDLPDIPEDVIAQVQEPIEATVIAADRTQLMAPQTNTTQAITPVQCPVCKQHTPPGEMYCTECGFLLNSAVSEEMPSEVQSVPRLTDVIWGREYLLKPGTNSVGRENADVLLADSRVSRHHAQITVTDTEITIEDPGSTNGTKVNGQQVKPGERVKLTSGAKIEFGGVALVVNIPEEVAEAKVVVTEPELAPFPDPTVETPVVSFPEVQPEIPFVEAVVPQSIEESTPQVVAASLNVTITNLSDPVLNQVFEIKPGSSTVGRKPDNDIVIANPYVSGFHGTLELVGNELYVTDIGSSNGTQLNEEPLPQNARTQVKDGDKVTFGQVLFAVQFEPVVSPDHVVQSDTDTLAGESDNQ
ncbi:MAG: FHA domain-containing protein [bacterium]